MKTKMNLNGGLAIGGGVLLGLGVGLGLLKISAILFIGSLLAGLGLGLIIAAFVAKEITITNNNKENLS